jgi:8-oxo-dGTP pyrophosphatase MutT (NUDIX family)/GNAT superfamily N-acetyltransferase
MLIQKRQPFKYGWPNMWDLTVGGSALSGESSQQAAMRETKEEVGIDIDLNDIRPHFTINFTNGFDDYYLITKNVDISGLSLQKEEVQQVRWVDREQLLDMVDSGEMIPYYFLNMLFDINKQSRSRVFYRNGIEIKYAEMKNLPSWMNLVEIVRWNFPGLETQELLDGYRETLIKNINWKSAICAVDGNMVVGVLLFSIKYNMLCCMAVHPEYRRRNIATSMVKEMMKNLDPEKDVIVDTFREDDPKGQAPRAFYKSLGFVEGELLSFQAGSGSPGYPEQRFILKAGAGIVFQ